MPTAAWAEPCNAGDDDPGLGHREARESGALPGIWQVAVSGGGVGALFWTVSDGRVPGGTAVPGDTRRSAGLYDVNIGVGPRGDVRADVWPLSLARTESHGTCGGRAGSGQAGRCACGGTMCLKSAWGRSS